MASLLHYIQVLSFVSNYTYKANLSFHEVIILLSPSPWGVQIYGIKISNVAS